jgi:hypothetical protein
MREYGPSIAPKPASIVRAITAVKRDMEVLAKEQNNSHGGYKYTSADQIYAFVSTRMAAAGLVIDCLEAEDPKIWTRNTADTRGNAKESQWMRIKFLFVLSTEEDTWSDPRATRTLAMPMTGPQSFMGAQSYAEKSYLRSLFKIPTGDVELDAMVEDGTFRPQPKAAPSKTKSSHALRKEGAWEEWEKSLADADDMTAVLELEQSAYQAFPNKWHEHVREAASRRAASLSNGLI